MRAYNNNKVIGKSSRKITDFKNQPTFFFLRLFPNPNGHLRFQIITVKATIIE